ncbi:hypothetical protein QVA66_05870 [Staphylococcus chromogenes]|nr:hypothetical protein [Staphylococcus chromogenes]
MSIKITEPKSVRKSSRHPWWKVMCLSGVDYYSTLGYQPGIALAAAGVLAPLATIVLVAVTMLGAVPVYRRIATESPGGQGSIAVLSRFIPGWKGKVAILILLGFAATDFMITMTLSAADASAHILHSTESVWSIPLTAFMLLCLAAVFYKGFSEAISISVLLVSSYLLLNALVIGRGLMTIAMNPELVQHWAHRLTMTYPDPRGMLLLALTVFPKIALGLSGFETGVSVIPQISGNSRAEQAAGGKKLLLTAAAIMSLYLITSSLVVTLLIPAEAAQPGGLADGRALAFVAYNELGSAFGAVYDVVTVAILWFAGASAMAGILNLIPRYLPRFGMAPSWVARPRPMVLIVAVIAIFITVVFRASVEKQSGAYATGVLVLLTSGALAVTLSARHQKQHGRMLFFAAVTAVFVATTLTNMVERPEGLHVAGYFIVGILLASLFSRVSRSFEIRSASIRFDKNAQHMIDAATAGRRLAIVAHSNLTTTVEDYEYKEREIRTRNRIPESQPLIFLEVCLRDASEFYSPLEIKGCAVGDASVLRVEASAIPNAIAAVASDIYDHSDVEMDLYFEWSPGNPIWDTLRYLVIGKGRTAVVVHEVLRRRYAGKNRLPHVHVS